MKPVFRLLPALLLAGCIHRGDLKPTLADVPPARLGEAQAAVFTPDPPPPGWWRLFNDPVLDRLIQDALYANRDLAVAQANYERFRATIREARGELYPTTSETAGYGYAGSSGRRGSELILSGSLSYELDFFGRVKSQIRAARGDARAADAAYQAVRLQVAADTTQAYVDGCGAERELLVALDNVRLQTETLRLTEVQLAAGTVSPLDTARARSLLESSRSAVPTFQAARASAGFRLAVLTGRRPGTLPTDVFACKAAPQVGQPIPTGDGTMLLQRRPDVRQQEANVYAAAARVGAAVGDLFPRITLGASISRVSGTLINALGGGLVGGAAGGATNGGATGGTNTGGVTTGGTGTGTGGTGSSSFSGGGDGLTFNIGPLISWSFPNLVAARARVAEARATNRQTVAQFESTVLLALQDTETALNAYARELDRRKALTASRDAAAEAARIVTLRYQVGRQNFLDVLVAEQTRSQAEAALAASELLVAQDQVAVFRALGGGWEPEAVASTRLAPVGATLNPGAVVLPEPKQR